MRQKVEDVWLSMKEKLHTYFAKRKDAGQDSRRHPEEYRSSVASIFVFLLIKFMDSALLLISAEHKH